MNVDSENSIEINNEYYYDFDYGFKVTNKLQNKYCIKGKYLKDFFSNKLVSINETIYLRNIIKQILNKIYPEMILNGDKLF